MLVLVQAAGVALVTAYLQLLASVLSAAVGRPGFPAGAAVLVAEAGTLAVVQLVSVVLLVTAGALALATRRPVARWSLVAASGLQLALAAYWAVRLVALLDGGAAVLALLVVVAAAAPAAALGLSVGAPARAWFAGSPTGGGPPHR
ncbi:hypothetical protein SAMN06893096_104297 [Geodermatophilus pulveris]|uniref:Uncharacterized protein n=1 Tax=Geodermatophilus pulveris TaxID=1564159 RepID=A0A239ETK2_9ACTN|nr:hypothetical protein [Geodermatophilus pulveris]SNS47985.1 hypothetical protein SAMN06893096_104297 [Geodermatophilus pulveris]